MNKETRKRNRDEGKGGGGVEKTFIYRDSETERTSKSHLPSQKNFSNKADCKEWSSPRPRKREGREDEFLDE